MRLPDVDVDVVVAVHDLARPVGATVLSALRGADLAGVLPSGHRVRVTVACHGLDAADVRRSVERVLEAAGEDELGVHVRYLEVRDGLRSPAGPFNAGLAAADGRWVSIIGSDDRYAEGALGAWATLGDELGSAWVMARLETDTGELVPTPRTRPGRTRDLDLVLDRLAYRTAPLGLLRRSTLVELGLLEPGAERPTGPLTPGLATGEDVELSLRLASSGERVDHAADLPPYVIGTGGVQSARPVVEGDRAHGLHGDGDRAHGLHGDGDRAHGLHASHGDGGVQSARPVGDGDRAHGLHASHGDGGVQSARPVGEGDRAHGLHGLHGGGGGGRVTHARRALADELAAHARLVDLRWVAALPGPARRAIVVKTLRIHVLGAVRRRPSPLDWAPGEAAWVRTLTRDLLALGPDAELALHRADRELLDAVLTAPDTDALAAASAHRADASRWDILLTPALRHNLDPESTVRQHLDHALSLTSTRGRELLAGALASRHTLHDAERPRVLVLSFSPVASDARVLKQVRHLARGFDVVTCGYGPAPDGVTAHVQVPDDVQNELDGRLITLRAYRAAYLAQGGVRWVRRHVAAGSADVVLANDLDAVPLALALRPRAGVHADLHEYFPRLHEEHEAWMRRISPYQEWLCRRFLPRCDAVTTVSGRIAEEYAEQFGVEVGVVTNASPYADLAPGPVGSPVLLVHSGACLRNRDLHVMVDAVVLAAREGAAVTLDLYLTPNDPGYLEELRVRAAASDGVVTVRDPVPYADLLGRLNGFDVGVHVLPPVSFNNANALPNKVFDYVQARLGLLVGPSPEMARLVHDHDLGRVAAGFDARSVAAAVRTLDAEAVEGFKTASHAAAHELSDAEQSRRWVESVRSIANRGR